MSKIVTITGAIALQPTSGFASGQSTIGLPTDITFVCKATDDQSDITLDGDAARTIVFGGGVVTANIVKITVIGGYLVARLTSAQGVAVIPVEPEALIISKNVGYTVLTLQRPPGVPVVAHVTLGEKS